MITLNQRFTDWENGLTVTALLERAHIIAHLAQVRIDGQPVHPGDYPDMEVPDEAVVEAFHGYGGG